MLRTTGSRHVKKVSNLIFSSYFYHALYVVFYSSSQAAKRVVDIQRDARVRTRAPTHQEDVRAG